MTLPRNSANKQERSLQLLFILAQMTIKPFNTKCFGQLYQEYRELNKIHIPSLETHVRVLYQIWADGKHSVELTRARVNVGHFH